MFARSDAAVLVVCDGSGGDAASTHLGKLRLGYSPEPKSGKGDHAAE